MQENRTHNQEKYQTIETKPEMTEMMESADKDFYYTDFCSRW